MQNDATTADSVLFRAHGGQAMSGLRMIIDGAGASLGLIDLPVVLALLALLFGGLPLAVFGVPPSLRGGG